MPPGTLVVAGLVAIALVVGVIVGVAVVSGDGDQIATAPPTSLEGTPTSEPASLSYTAEELASTFGDAVWRVDSLGCDELWTGTAFAVDPHHLVTNHHVVANSTRPSLRSRGGDRVDGTVIGWSERPDVAVIRVDTELDQWLEWAAADQLREGQRLVALGYPVPARAFTATPGSILSFQARTDVREAIRTDAALDRGNSGGPALDSRGQVIGVVTEMAPNLSGFQLVPLIFTYDALSELIEGFIAEPSEPEVDCAAMWATEPVPDAPEPETWSSGAETYGDHEMLDTLWDRCAAEDFTACDDLWWLAPPGSEYESFGDTCGGRRAPEVSCVESYGP